LHIMQKSGTGSNIPHKTLTDQFALKYNNCSTKKIDHHSMIAQSTLVTKQVKN